MAEPSASVADWIAVVAGSLGALIATLDISITNSALPQIQGEIGATGTEGTWISTGYLMSRDRDDPARRLADPRVRPAHFLLRTRSCSPSSR